MTDPIAPQVAWPDPSQYRVGTPEREEAQRLKNALLTRLVESLPRVPLDEYVPPE